MEYCIKSSTRYRPESGRIAQTTRRARVRRWSASSLPGCGSRRRSSPGLRACGGGGSRRELGARARHTVLLCCMGGRGAPLRLCCTFENRGGAWSGVWHGWAWWCCAARWGGRDVAHADRPSTRTKRRFGLAPAAAAAPLAAHDASTNRVQSEGRVGHGVRGALEAGSAMAQGERQVLCQWTATSNPDMSRTVTMSHTVFFC